MASESVTLTLVIPSGWINDYIFTSDLFRHNCCGYWLRGLSDTDDAMLVWEHDDTRMPEEKEERIAQAWQDAQGTPNMRTEKAKEFAEEEGYKPETFFAIDRAVAQRIYAECVRLYGEREASCADASQLDCAVQMALLGEIRYG